MCCCAMHAGVPVNDIGAEGVASLASSLQHVPRLSSLDVSCTCGWKCMLVDCMHVDVLLVL